jgi:hypothetical protein
LGCSKSSSPDEHVAEIVVDYLEGDQVMGFGAE